MAYQNFYSSKITNPIGAGDVTITVDNAPTSTSGRMVLEARNATQREIIKYTGVAGNVLTGVTRGQGGTTAKQHVAGSLIQQNATAEDLQDLYDAFASFSVSANDWRTLVPAVTGVVANGNHQYDVTFASTVAAVLSPGMRVRTTRTVNNPTQCTSLNGTTQYYNCLSATVAADFTFTDDWAAGTWMKLAAYPGGSAGIICRYNATSGFCFIVDSAGNIQLQGFNGGGGNYSVVLGQKQIPLNKWVYVVAQLDMSAFTATTTTSYVMLDGINLLASVARAGTNPTALVQPAVDLQVGARNSIEFFNGKLAQTWVSSGKVTQANANTLYSQGLTPALITANNIISAYSFDNSINDLNTTSANNLTANGSAVATNADSFTGTQADGTMSTVYDYGVVASVNGAVATIVTADGCTIPTSGGVTSVSYSGAVAPYNAANCNSITNYSNTQFNTSAPALTATSQDLARNGLNINVSVTANSIAKVTVSLAISTTSDMEFHPEIRIAGTLVKELVPVAAPGFAGNRATQRTVTCNLPLASGNNLISAGVFIFSGGSYSMPANAGYITVEIIKGVGTGN